MTRNPKIIKEEIQTLDRSLPATAQLSANHRKDNISPRSVKRDRDQNVRFEVKDGDKLLQGDVKQHEEQESA